jgi:hypothetical protein
LNVRKVTLSQDRELYGVEMHAEPNYPTLGKKAAHKFVCFFISPYFLQKKPFYVKLKM